MLTPAKIIQKKRDGGELSPEEIRFFIDGLQNGNVADYQATAFLMSVYFQSMTLDETVSLTRAMLESGERLDLSHLPGFKVDKHSTGGVGDKASLILAPLAAACGLVVPMMAGRGLGYSGGTLDKLESIPGFNVRPTPQRFQELLATLGFAIIGQSEKIAPADRKLYSLRDVTATVDCIPLIVGSILSKKLAEGTDGLVIDVKVGTGAFMKSTAEAKRLAKTLVQVGTKLGLKIRAVLTDMNQPLGCTAGNSLEVLECLEVMRGKGTTILQEENCAGSADLRELTLQLCAHMIEIGGIARSRTAARKLATEKLNDGSAWKNFRAMTEAQGGAVDWIDNPSKFPLAPQKVVLRAPKAGYWVATNTQTIGELLIELGGGRKRAEDTIDFGVGFLFQKKMGAKLKAGDPLCTVFAPQGMNLQALESSFLDAVTLSSTRKEVPPLVVDTLE